MARRKRSHVNTDTVDNGSCNEALVAQILESFNKESDHERFRPWTADEERARTAELKDKDPEQLKYELICHNVFLAADFIKKYKNRFFSISTEDLVSNIYWGLVQAAQKFDPRRGNRFCTFAYWYLRKWALKPFQTNQWKVSNMTTCSFDNMFSSSGNDADDSGSCHEASIMAVADPSCMPSTPQNPIDAVMQIEEYKSSTSTDTLIDKMRAYALSGAFTAEEHTFYRMKYIENKTPTDIRKSRNMTLSDYRRMDKRIVSSLKDYMARSKARA